jgi:hypothetical protein
MSQRPTLDASTFEGLLAAAWVLKHEQEARNHRPAPDETLAEPLETHVEPHCVCERDTTNARLMATLSELSKVANRLRVSMRVRCANCNNESDSRCRFCGMCGTQLLEPKPTPQTEPPAQSNPAREQVPPVGGSLLLPGLADEPDGSFAYLLEDDVSTSHWRRVLVLVVLLGCVAAAVWHWRRDLRDWAARFSHRPAATQPEQVSYSPAPISTLGSEAAGAVPNARALRETPAAESAAQPAHLHPGRNNAVQENTVARAERFPRPGTVLAQVQTPAGGTLLNTNPASKKDEQSAMYQNIWTPTIHKMQGPGDGVWVKTATKPSPEIPFDSVAMATRHSVRGVSRPTTGTSMPGRNRDEPTSGAVRAGTVAPAGVSRENPPAALSAVDATQGASFHNSESQTPRDTQSTMDRNKRTPTDHKIESLAAGGRENAATKPSAGRPFDSVAMAPRHYVPRPPPGFRTSNIAAKAGHADPRPPSAGGPLVNESRSEPVQWAVSRYVPRPPWSSRSGRTSEPSVPRPPARRVPRAPSGVLR